MKGSVPVLFCHLHSRLQRGQGEKREGVQISEQSTPNLSYQNLLHWCSLVTKFILNLNFVIYLKR